MTLVGREGGDLDLLVRSDHDEPSVFQPASLLREARRQRRLDGGPVPAVCLLDPDGDVVRHIIATGRAERCPAWACYHTELWETRQAGIHLGVVGHAVGAPFAVLIAEQLFASGCSLLLSVTSAGQIADHLEPPCFILAEAALRGEGTSLRYLPPSLLVAADHVLLKGAASGLAGAGIPVVRATTWTTDAPYRETPSAIAAARAAGAVAVEMEIAALYAFAEAQRREVVCFAHLTNRLGQVDGDFEKGPAAGAEEALAVAAAAARGCLGARQPEDR